MKGKDEFTQKGIEELKRLIVQRNEAPSEKQKSIRNKMRKIGFYGKDDWGISNLQVSDLDKLIRDRKIKVIDQPCGGIQNPVSAKVVNSQNINFMRTTTDIASDLEDNLVKGVFCKISSLNSADLQVPGFYCIKLSAGCSLPQRYQVHLSDTRLLYIGKAEGQTLLKRFYNQELNAKGHGTYFRSIGAVLGYRPEKGSLFTKKNKKNYTFSAKDEKEIIEWMHENLKVSWVEYKGDFSVEQHLIAKYCPLLNNEHNPKKLQELKKDREECRRIACLKL